jgi:3alpha(or 20beta)-hydroxysteroid dehydrogenase
MARLQDKVAIVSGAAQGIGEAIARLLVAEGAKVVVADIKDKQGKAIAAAFKERGLFVHVDVTSTADWQNAVAQTLAQFDGLDILVNNAGGAAGIMPIAEEKEADHRWTMDVNVTGCWAGCRAVVPIMAAHGGGAIVNISSMDGLVGISEMATYAAAKFAITGLTRSLALELGKDNIRVNSVHPGFINTPLTQQSSPRAKQRLQRTLAQQPIPRFGTPEEVARAVLFLASDEASYCTGSSLVVDGGHIAGPYRESIKLATNDPS